MLSEKRVMYLNYAVCRARVGTPRVVTYNKMSTHVYGSWSVRMPSLVRINLQRYKIYNCFEMIHDTEQYLLYCTISFTIHLVSNILVVLYNIFHYTFGQHNTCCTVQYLSLYTWTATYLLYCTISFTIHLDSTILVVLYNIFHYTLGQHHTCCTAQYLSLYTWTAPYL
jgi:hypothetical protein